jgi:CRP-like cAMP-binding protein
MFRPLQLTTIEELAGQLERVEVATGDVVIRQGEPGDRFYIVEFGRLAVTIDGRIVREVGPGDSFGEIALIRDVPRTATVTALVPASLGALARVPFLAAVAGQGDAAVAAEVVIRGRLAA